jgi:hypothetical protein
MTVFLPRPPARTTGAAILIMRNPPDVKSKAGRLSNTGAHRNIAPLNGLSTGELPLNNDKI